MNYKELAERTEAYIIEQRRWLHQHPELSWEEFNTTDHIQEELEKMGLEVQRFPERPGCCAIIRGGKATADSKMVALRADIDALPVLEKTGLPYASVNENVMHACGHDSHAAMLLGAAKMLVESREELCGNVKLFFQSAEETAHGADYYVAQGVLEGVSAIMGQHVWGTFDAPYISLTPGRRMASCDNFTIKVEGISTHGTTPHLGVDALLASASILMNIQSFVSRNNDPLNPLVLTIGEMHAGQRFNIIANHSEMYGSVRTFNPEFRKTIEGKLRRIIEDTASALGATATLEYEYFPSAVINRYDDINKLAHDAAVKLYGEECLKDMPMVMGSEDFAYYMDEIPGIFGFLGSRNESKGIVASNHNDCYTVDEDILQRGAALYAQFAADFLEANA